MKIHTLNARILALVLTLAMILGAVPMGVFAAESPEPVPVLATEEDAYRIIDQINAIGEVTLEDEPAVLEIRAAYNALPDYLQDKVYNLHILEEAETVIHNIKTPPLPDGNYKVNVKMLNEKKNQLSGMDVLFALQADIVIEGDTAVFTLLVANPVPAFHDQGADGTFKNVTIRYGGKQYNAESVVGSGTQMTAKTTNLMFGIHAGEQYPAQVLTFTLPSHAIRDDSMFFFCGFFNVLTMGDAVMRMSCGAVAMMNPKYSVSVENGTGAGEYREGETVALRADDLGEGCTFSHWETVSGGPVSILDPDSPETSFLMPARPVSVIACYVIDKPGFAAEIIPEGRRFVNSVTVRLTGPEGWQIFYSLDGYDPIYKGTLYEGPITLTESTRVSAAAINAGVRTPLAIAHFIKTEYTDIQGHWGQEYIEYVIDEGLFIGTDDDQFSPERTMDRSMFVTVLGRLAGVDPEGSGETRFTDVPENEWYAPYVAWAVENGITVGKSETTFEPETEVTREEMACFLMRFCNLMDLRLTTGDKIDFADADEIQLWAVESVDALTSAGLLIGNQENCFKPQDNLTRAEAATVFTRLLKNYWFI